jgi:predicted phosphodiesterase
LVARAFAHASVPVHAVLGNHDVGSKSVDGRAALARYGYEIPTVPVCVELPGIRVVLAHTADAGQSRGAIDAAQRERIAELVGETGGPAFLGMHHYVDLLPMPTRYPVGIRREPGRALLQAVAATNPNTFVSTGHTHRNRRTRRFGIPITEVGSTKDYPGVWAGYAVYEGGIRQVVRRIGDPACLAWTERTKSSLAGLWRYWSPGRLSWRCFTHRWR